MIKVVTVTCTTKISSGNFREDEYPVLNKYLEEGYWVKEVVPKVSDQLSTYSLTFILRNE